ncbi:uncharacterized protein [Erythrolamprus reginae]
MWQQGYLDSLTPLLGALDEAGLSTQVLGVSLAPNDTQKWDHSFSASMLGSVSTMLGILEDTGFYFILGQFCTLLRGLEGVSLRIPDEWKKQCSEGGVLKALVPSLRILVQMAPWKVSHSFRNLQIFLQQVEGDWNGRNCVSYLTVTQEELEALQPMRTLNWLEMLYKFLRTHRPYLTRLANIASHPEAREKMAYLNFWPMLLIAEKVMESGMEYYHDCLTDLQVVLQDLSEVEAIVPSADELDLY